jgi:hypothetical protein
MIERPPINEPILIKDRMSPVWQRWFSKVLMIALGENTSTGSIPESFSEVLQSNDNHGAISIFETLIYQFLEVSNKDFERRLGDLEKYIYQYETKKSYDKQLSELETKIYTLV